MTAWCLHKLFPGGGRGRGRGAGLADFCSAEASGDNHTAGPRAAPPLRPLPSALCPLPPPGRAWLGVALCPGPPRGFCAWTGPPSRPRASPWPPGWSLAPGHQEVPEQEGRAHLAPPPPPGQVTREPDLECVRGRFPLAGRAHIPGCAVIRALSASGGAWPGDCVPQERRGRGRESGCTRRGSAGFLGAGRLKRSEQGGRRKAPGLPGAGVWPWHPRGARGPQNAADTAAWKGTRARPVLERGPVNPV